MLIDDTYSDLFTGQPTRPTRLDDDAWKRLIETTHRVADLAEPRRAATGLSIRTPRRTSSMKIRSKHSWSKPIPRGCRSAWIPGHHAYRGGDPVAFFRRHHARIPYLHLKSVDPKKQEWVERERIPFAIAVGNDMFCEPSVGRRRLRRLSRRTPRGRLSTVWPPSSRTCTPRRSTSRCPSPSGRETICARSAWVERRIVVGVDRGDRDATPMAWSGNRTRPPRAGVRYRVLGLACALAVVTYIHRLGFSTGAPEIKRSLGLDDEQIGYLMAAFLVAYGLFQMPRGLLGDRFGGRHVLTILVLGWSLLTAAVALAVLLPHVAALQFAFLLVAAVLSSARSRPAAFPCWAGSWPTGCPSPSAASRRAASGCSAAGVVHSSRSC